MILECAVKAAASQSRENTEKYGFCTYLHEVFLVGFEVGHAHGQLPGRPGGEVGPLDGGLGGPLLLGRQAHDVEDLVELVHLVLALKEGGTQEELGEDAATGPYVYGGGVWQAQQDFWAPVPQRDNLTR